MSVQRGNKYKLALVFLAFRIVESITAGPLRYPSDEEGNLHRYIKRSSMNLDSNESIVQDASQESQKSIKRNRLKKYPALYDALSTTTIGTFTFEPMQGALYMHTPLHDTPVAIWDASSRKSLQRPSRSHVVSDNGSHVRKDGTDGRVKPLGWYARQRNQAEKEGRLEEFLQSQKERITKIRRDESKEEKKHRERYDYARKKANSIALEVIDPESAFKRREEYLERKRLYNKMYAERRKMLSGKNQAVPMQREDTSSSREHQVLVEDDEPVFHDFDLNEVASDNINLNDADSIRDEDEIELNLPAQEADDDYYQYSKRAFHEEEASSEPSPSVSRSKSNSKPSRPRVKHQALLALSREISASQIGPGHLKEASAQIQYNVESGKVQVKLKHDIDIVELDPRPIDQGSDDINTSDRAPTYYEKKMQEAWLLGPEAYEAHRQKLREQNRKSYHKLMTEKPRDRSEYFKHANLLRKQRLAILKETNPEEYERKWKEKKEKGRNALRKYREKIKMGLPVKTYNRLGRVEVEDGHEINAEDEVCEELAAVEWSRQEGEEISNAEVTSKSSFKPSEKTSFDFDLNRVASDEDEGFYL